MAKLNVEIDDAILEAVDKAGFVVVRYGGPKAGEWVWSSWFQEPTVVVGPSSRKHPYLVIERKPDDSIPFPDWVPEWANHVAVDDDGTVEVYETSPDSDGGYWICSVGKSCSLSHHGFDTSWVPQIPDGDWTKAKWRRKSGK